VTNVPENLTDDRCRDTPPNLSQGERPRSHGRTAAVSNDLKHGPKPRTKRATILGFVPCFVPKGMGKALAGPIAGLGLLTVEFEKNGSRFTFDGSALGRCLK